ncbi:hypothetical protein L4C38_12450 [Vibrio kasasachensis]|uniref:hypothetical protein n=1 Tax=Vibrio kasasachensis TaxID=2910248 RepID=UPI003D0F010A
MIKRKIYFFTRSYTPEYCGGGAIVREQTVTLLREKGYDVTVVLFTTNPIMWREIENVIPIEVTHNLLRPSLILEHLGLMSDYLSPWVENAVKYLVKQIKKDDILLATSGGELGCIELAAKIKRITGAKLLVNLHDPINHSKVLGIKIPTRFHVDRTKKAYKVLAEANAIITSSKLYANELKNKIPSNIIVDHWYFGFSGEPGSIKASNEISNGFNLVYAGNMNNMQKPQVLLESLIGKPIFDSINFHFFGSGINSEIIKSYGEIHPNVYFHGQKSQDYIHDFYANNAQAGFISLIGDYFKPFVPSKLYDYIRFGLPVVAYLPDGDACNLINMHGLGVVGSDLVDLEKNLTKMIEDQELYEKIRRDVTYNVSDWSIKHTSKALFDVIDKIQD